MITSTFSVRSSERTSLRVIGLVAVCLLGSVAALAGWTQTQRETAERVFRGVSRALWARRRSRARDIGHRSADTTRHGAVSLLSPQRGAGEVDVARRAAQWRVRATADGSEEDGARCVSARAERLLRPVRPCASRGCHGERFHRRRERDDDRGRMPGRGCSFSWTTSSAGGRRARARSGCVFVGRSSFGQRSTETRCEGRSCGGFGTGRVGGGCHYPGRGRSLRLSNGTGPAGGGPRYGAWVVVIVYFVILGERSGSVDRSFHRCGAVRRRFTRTRISH